jgi:uncharacterized protein DUF6655
MACACGLAVICLHDPSHRFPPLERPSRCDKYRQYGNDNSDGNSIGGNTLIKLGRAPRAAVVPCPHPQCVPHITEGVAMHGTGAGFLIFMALILTMLALGACTKVRETSPQRTATEQLLIPTAVDRAIARVNLKIPPGTKVFVAAEQLQSSDDGKYVVGEMKDRLLRNGAHLVDERFKADAVVEIRAGALSIDEKQVLVGIGAFEAPVPLAGQAAKIPQIALYQSRVRQGVAKIAAFGYSTSDGKLIDIVDPQFRYSHEYERTLLFFFTWRSTDLPEQKNPNIFSID